MSKHMMVDGQLLQMNKSYGEDDDRKPLLLLWA